MSHLDSLSSAGLHVGWRTLLVGLEGPGKFPPLVTVKEVREYAEQRLAEEESPPPEVIAIAVASGDAAGEVNVNLHKLAGREQGAPSREVRKWRLVLLTSVLDSLPQDPLYGLLKLTEFWERFDFPEDGPHVVQGRGNQASPSDYFTEDNFKRLVRKHEEWIAAEAADLKREALHER